MYTQCIKCETVFRLSAETLRAAGGQVRCGRCGEVFNALARLAEEPSAFPASESPLDMETRANEILESPVPPLEQPDPTSASGADDSIDIGDFNSTDLDFARLQVVEKFVEDLPPQKSAMTSAGAKAAAPAPRPALPVRGAPPRSAPAPASNSLSRAVAPAGARAAPSSPGAARPTPPQAAAAGAPAPAQMTATSKPKSAPSSVSSVTALPRTAAPAPAATRAPATTPAPATPPAPAAATGPPLPAPATAPGSAPSPAPRKSTGTAAEDPLDDGSMEFTLPPGELDRIFVERSANSRPSSDAAASSDANPAAEAFQAVEESRKLPELGNGFEVSEDVRREMLSGISEPALPAIAGPTRRSIPFNVWLSAAGLLALLLCAQFLNGNREWFATHAPWRGSLRGLYAALGIAVAAPANLSAYQLRQWGVTGDPNANGTLRVRASILNTAAQLQPYPLLRVTLANRFGAKIGARDFEPAEYMGKPIVRMLAPGERADATLDIVDPGKDAEGFEIDVCVRGVDQKIACAGDVAARAKP